MSNPCLADFYHGWIIEIMYDSGGYKNMCYSPCRQRLSDFQSYPDDFQALAAAKQLINQQLVRYVLQGFLREMYESGRLEFEEWRSLNQSLMLTAPNR